MGTIYPAMGVNWDALLSCVGALNALFLVLALVGIAIAIRGELRAGKAERLQKTAERAARIAKDKLLARSATEDFLQMAERANELLDAAGASEWRPAEQLLRELSGKLAQANGSFGSLIKGLQMDQLEAGLGAVRSLSVAMPGDGTEVTADVHNGIKEQCAMIRNILYEIYGKLKFVDPEDPR